MKYVLVCLLPLMIGCSKRDKNNFVADDGNMVILSAKQWGEGYRYTLTDAKNKTNKAVVGWELETKEVYHVGDEITISLKEQE